MKRISKPYVVVISVLVLILSLLAFPAGALAVSWTKTNVEGFGNRRNGGVTSMCEFGSNLYVGTQNDIYGCEVWRSSNGTDWTKANINGFGDPNNFAASSVFTFGSNLYVGTYNNRTGCELWRSSNGTHWDQANTDGFGDKTNWGAYSMCEFGSDLYVGTENNSNGCEVWRSSDGTNWSQVNRNGFDNRENNKASSICVFNSNLYVGTQNNNEGCEVWRYDGPNPEDWKKVNKNGFGKPVNYYYGSILCVFGSNLYAGTQSWDSCRVWRSSNGTDWTRVNRNGFEDANNNSVQSMYVFCNSLYIGTQNNSTGCELWRSSNGTHWDRINTDGFGEVANASVSSMSVFGSNFYVGTSNESTGCQIWRTPGPSPESTSYLAEGTTAWGYDTYITIVNPNNEELHAKITYMDPSAPANGKGIAATRTVVLPALSQTTVDPRWDLGDTDFSTKVECLEGKAIAVDRTMFWTADGTLSSEGHSSIGVNAPSKSWYLPEGSSAWGFKTWTLIENPNAEEAKVTLTYMIEGAGPKTVEKTIPAYSRSTSSMAADLGFEADASVRVTSDKPVIAEGSIYKNNEREGSCSVGATEPFKDYFLSEGSTAYGFTTYILVQNPNNSETDVTLTYMTPGGPKEQPKFTIPVNSRKTIKVNDALPNTDFSTHVNGTKPIIAERSMYWGEGTPLGEAMHASIGLSSPHMSFYLPDGQSSEGRETYTLVANPNEASVTVEITYLPQGGGKAVSFKDEIPGGSRKTYSMTDKVENGRASIMVKSLQRTRPIMVERSMYWNNRGAGTDTIGGYSD